MMDYWELAVLRYRVANRIDFRDISCGQNPSREQSL